MRRLIVWFCLLTVVGTLPSWGSSAKPLVCNFRGVLHFFYPYEFVLHENPPAVQMDGSGAGTCASGGVVGASSFTFHGSWYRAYPQNPFPDPTGFCSRTFHSSPGPVVATLTVSVGPTVSRSFGLHSIFDYPGIRFEVPFRATDSQGDAVRGTAILSNRLAGNCEINYDSFEPGNIRWHDRVGLTTAFLGS